MTSQLPALCLSCRHREPTSDPATGTPTVARCSAYPTGIPRDVAWGADHHEPRGDEADGLVYEQAPGDEAESDLKSWQAFTTVRIS